MRVVEQVMGTVVSIEAPHAAAADTARAVEWLHRVDEVFSTYRPESEISRLGRGELTPDQCVPEVREVLALCELAEREGAGWFSARAGGGLDPSGAVKGWAVQRAAELIGGDCLVNGGGDVQAYGRPEPGRGWSVAVAHPLHPGGIATVVTGDGAAPLAVATSGSAERGGHVIDPHTGRPARALASLTVVGAELTEVDIAATTAYAMAAGDQARARAWIEERPGLEGFAMLPSGRAWWTSGFPKHGLVPGG
ncbi:FAD:protein FMN transferase [Phaeacidiphilus oryzae]|uniref:FAD:protein FMN transferase n=1 Tax=Phaeacidiphilus oryzae TaxID=348818 RepID=UPI000AC06763|nr:FAD:protein FMN transferase [Phaeacidiphilus oryzae]